MDSIMLRLRQETRPNHDAVEKASHSHKIMDNSLTVEDYKKLIVVNYRFHEVMEPFLAENLNGAKEDIKFDNRHKTPLLKQDLLDLGYSEEEIANWPKWELGFELPNEEAALGAMYVLEGATLGGAVIKKQLANNQNLTHIEEMHYYGCYGREIGEQWKSFGAYLANRVEQKPDTGDAVVQAAKDTFESLERLMLQIF